MAYDKDASLARYIDRVRAFPTLSREQELVIARRAKTGDQDGVRALVEANLRYVVAVALQYRRYGIRVSDLVAEGNVGLMMAVRKFDPELGNRFVTYAGYWIRAYVLDCVVRSTSMVGAGSGPLRSKLFFRLRRERARLHNLVDSQEELIARLAEHFEVSPEKMQNMLQRLDSRDLSLDQTVFNDSTVTMLDLLVDTGPGQEEAYAEQETRTELRARLDEALATLDQRERFIVEQRMLAEDTASLAAIGRTLGVSRERARQLEARAKRKLRERLGDFAHAA